MDPRDLIRLAQDLLEGVEGEDAPQASLRTVVNRAYLGALLFSAEALRGAKGAIYPRDHTYYERVESDLYDIDRGLRERLWSLRQLRAEADYELSHDIQPGMSSDSLALADHLVTEIREKVL